MMPAKAGSACAFYFASPDFVNDVMLEPDDQKMKGSSFWEIISSFFDLRCHTGVACIKCKATANSLWRSGLSTAAQY